MLATADNSAAADFAARRSYSKRYFLLRCRATETPNSRIAEIIAALPADDEDKDFFIVQFLGSLPEAEQPKFVTFFQTSAAQ